MADPAARTITMTSSEAQALEAQIGTQTLTDKQAARYFPGAYCGMSVTGMETRYATASQVRRLAHKNRRAVKGLNPWINEDAGNGFFTDPHEPEPLQIPADGVCEFCEKPLEHLAILYHANSRYEWEVERWSEIPMRCNCEKAAEKWAAQDAEDERRAQEEKRQREESVRKAKAKERLARSGMKARFLSRTFANFRTDTPGRARAYRIAKEYADNFAAHSANGDGLYIEGTFGTGKTHLAAAIALQLMEQGYSVIFRTADDLLRDIKATFDGAGEGEQEVQERIKGCGLLVIDDIGKEQATDWTTAQLYAIINDRYESQKPLIVTTNFNETDLTAVESPKGVGEHRIKAILSRLHETCRLMSMNWQDWRGAR